MKVIWKQIDSGTLLLVSWDDIVADPSWLSDDRAST
ncbi:hypothetical protein LCGC14_2961650, partial [marine sediment metagenome]